MCVSTAKHVMSVRLLANRTRLFQHIRYIQFLWWVSRLNEYLWIVSAHSPRTKSGNKFLLTVMCSAMRFPEAIPMRKITAPAVVKALVKFFSTQGSDFMSRIFAKVLKQLNIPHCHSSAYPPESQGAIERFHQTLKSDANAPDIRLVRPHRSP